MSAKVLRAITDGDWPHIATLFWDTFVLGAPVPFEVRNKPLYEDLVLGWYRSHPGDSRVVVADGAVVGYVLVCTEQRPFERQQQRAGLHYLERVLPRLLGSSISGDERRFLAYRLLDGYEAWRDEDPKAVGAHAHFNVARGHRSGLLVRDFVEHIDEMCLGAGLTHWTGQINARKGRRLGLLLSYGFHVDSRTPNRTLTWLTGSRVERLTVVRRVGAIERLEIAS